MAESIINGIDILKNANDGHNEGGQFFHFGLNPKVKLASISYEKGDGYSDFVKVVFAKPDGSEKDFHLFLPDPKRENYEKQASWLMSNLKHIAHVFENGEKVDQAVIDYYTKKGIQPTFEAVVKKYVEAMNKLLDFQSQELDLFLEYSKSKDGKQYLQIPLFPKWLVQHQPVKGEWKEIRDPEKGLYYVDSEDPSNIHPIRKSAKWLTSDRATKIISGEQDSLEGAKTISADSILDDSEDDTFLGSSLLE